MYLKGAPWARTEKNTEKKPSYQSLSHEPGSEQSERASERVSAAEGVSEASSLEQVNEGAVRANEQTDERMAQYLVLTSLFLFVPAHSAMV